MPSRSVREIRADVALGRPISDGERKQLREYEARHSPSRHGLYVREDLWGEWKAEATQQASSLSAWVCERVEEARAGASDEVLKAWKEEVKRLQADKAVLQGAIGDLGAQLREKDFQIHDLSTQLQYLLTTLKEKFGAEVELP